MLQSFASLSQAVIKNVPDIWEVVGKTAYFLTTGTGPTNFNCVYLWNTNGTGAIQVSSICMNLTNSTNAALPMTGGFLQSFPYNPDGKHSYTPLVFQSAFGSNPVNADHVHAHIYNTANSTWISGNVGICTNCNATWNYIQVFPYLASIPVS